MSTHSQGQGRQRGDRGNTRPLRDVGAFPIIPRFITTGNRFRLLGPVSTVACKQRNRKAPLSPILSAVSDHEPSTVPLSSRQATQFQRSSPSRLESRLKPARNLTAATNTLLFILKRDRVSNETRNKIRRKRVPRLPCSNPRSPSPN